MSRRTRALLAGLLALTVAGTAALAQSPLQNRRFDLYDAAILGALNKVTGTTNLFRVPVGFQVEFDTLTIGVRTCRKTPPEELPEAVAYLEIREERETEEGLEDVERYRGFMFASSPAVGAMEHPVYDVWIVDCQVKLGPAPTPPPGGFGLQPFRLTPAQ